LVEAWSAVRHNPWMLRRLAGLQTCLAFLLAFVMGPFQHVHHSQDAHHDDEVATLVHAHPYGISFAGASDHHARIDDVHGPHAAWSLDTFTILTHTSQFLFVPPESKVLPYVPAEPFFALAVVEIRGHDPPHLEHLSPRAPPV